MEVALYYYYTGQGGGWGDDLVFNKNKEIISYKHYYQLGLETLWSRKIYFLNEHKS